MKRRSTNTMTGLFAMFCIALLAMTAGGPELRAQRWEGLYGDTASQFGVHGVQPLASGGYIAAGYHGGIPGTSPDIYVVRIFPNGTIWWANTYDLGLSLGGEKTSCVLQSNANGDIIVVGHATFSACFGNNSGDIYMLRLNEFNGAMNCAATIGGPNTGENAWRVIETNFGDPTQGTSAGDLVICGSRWDNISGDGYLVRTDKCGNIIWDQVYNDTNGHEDLHDVVESQTPGFGQGDLIAAGVSSSFNTAFLNEGLLLRVDGNNGKFTTPLHAAAVYSGGNQTRFNTVKELQTWPNQGLIVAAGQTEVPAQSSDIYILKTNPHVCFPIIDMLYGDMTTGTWDYAEDIQEVLSPGAGGLTVGNLVLTGSSNMRPGTNSDIYLLEVEPNGLGLAGSGFHLYGSTGWEQGWSLRPVYDPGSAWPTDGFILCGGMWGGPFLPPNDPSQLYLIKTDATGSSNCTDVPYPIAWFSLGYPANCVTYNVLPQHIFCQARTWPVPLPDFFLLCYSYPKLAPGATAPAEESEVKTYPNPVMKGRSVEVECTMGEASSALLTVTDVAGNVVLQRSEEFSEGRNRITLATESWSAGTYLVSVKVGERVQTQRIVVTE